MPAHCNIGGDGGSGTLKVLCIISESIDKSKDSQGLLVSLGRIQKQKMHKPLETYIMCDDGLHLWHMCLMHV